MTRACQGTDGGGWGGGDGGDVRPPGEGCAWVWVCQAPGSDPELLPWRRCGRLCWGSVLGFPEGIQPLRRTPARRPAVC